MSHFRFASAGLATGCCLLSCASALAANPSTTMSVAASCAGDTISGRVVVRAARGTPFSVRLLQRTTQRSRWAAIGRSKRFRAAGGRQSYRFRFNVSAFAAYAYRLRLTRAHSRVLSQSIAGSSCGPGRQVPDARLALLLPLSLLGTTGVLLLLRRRASH
jgi:hypothetical protein